MAGIETQGTVFEIGQGDAATVVPGSDTFDTVGCVKTFDGPNGTAAIIDATCLDSTAKEKLIGLRDEGSMSLTLNRLFSNAGQTSCQAARVARQLRNFKITYQDGSSTVGSFTGYVQEFSVSGGVDNVLEASITIEISGAYTEA